MDDRRFDRIARTVAAVMTTRRSLTTGLAGGAIASAMGLGGAPAPAAKCVAPGKRCKTKRGKRPCCGGAKCKGTKCKCPPGRPPCGQKCCARGQRCQKRRCVPKSNTRPPSGCTSDVCASGCPFTTLAAAVAAATPGSTIQLCAGTYTAQDVQIGKNLTVRGAGAGTTVLDAGGAERVITINSGNVTFEDLTITGARGGEESCKGILNRGALTMRRVTVTDNTMPDTFQVPSGGGICNLEGTLHLTGCHITQNKVPNGQGGGIYNFDGDVTLTNCTIAGNVANSGGGMYSINRNPSRMLTLTGCTIENNTARVGGGVQTSTPMTMTNCLVRKNRAEGLTAGYGGGIFHNIASLTLTNSSVTENEAAVFGGGIRNNAGTIILDNTNVTLNKAERSAGIYTAGGVIISRNGSKVTHNEADSTLFHNAGGILNSDFSTQISIEPGSVVNNSPFNCRPENSVQNCLD